MMQLEPRKFIENKKKIEKKHNKKKIDRFIIYYWTIS